MRRTSQGTKPPTANSTGSGVNGANIASATAHDEERAAQQDVVQPYCVRGTGGARTARVVIVI